MSFPRSNNKINIKYPAPTNQFAAQLGLISEAINLDLLIKSAAARINLADQVLQRMILSKDEHTKYQVQLLKNLGASLAAFDNGDGILPEQLQLYITELQNHVLEHPLDDASLPSYANIIFHNQVDIHNNIYYAPAIHIEDYDYDVDGDNLEYEQKVKVPILFAAVDKEKIKNDVCTICLLGLDENKNNKVVQTKCNHQYHEDCIIYWVNIKQTCPLCRFEF
jgi:hypothetical protein